MRRRAILAGAVASLVTGRARAQKTCFDGFDQCFDNRLLGGLPALDLNMLSGALDGRMTFSRASTATYFDSTGTMQSAANNVARFDSDPVAHTPLGLLIEEQRTNLAVQSGDFTNAAYTKSALAITASGTAPDGSTASLITENTATSAHAFFGTGFSIGAGTAVVSVFVKAGTQRYISLRGEDTTGSLVYPWITFDTQAATINANGSVLASGSIALINGWYRIWFAWTALTNGAANMVVAGSNVSTAPPTSSVLGNSYTATSQTWNAWGLQAESGGFLTSYIPTTTSAATRVQDVATIPTSSWYQAISTGSWETDFQINQLTPAGVSFGIASICDGTAANSIRHRIQASGNTTVASDMVTASASQAAINAGNWTVGAANKVATKWAAATGIVECINGGSLVTGSATLTIPTVNVLKLGSWGDGTNPIDGYIRRVRYWPRYLSDGELQQVTT